MTAAVIRDHYTPRGAAAELFERQDPELLIAGPAGTGKSLACMFKLHMMALTNPGFRALMVRKTQKSLAASALETWKAKVIPSALEANAVEFHGARAEAPAQYEYANGSRVILGGMDNASRFMSTDLDAVYAQEATELTEDDWEKLTTRLRHGAMSFQQIIADANPDHDQHWLKRRCDRGQTTMLYSRHTDNPDLYDENGELTPRGTEYIGRLDNLTGVRLARLRHGRWVAAEGQIWEQWDPSVHLIDPHPIPDDWTRWWSVDFGYVAPMVVQHWAEDPDGGLEMYREFYGTRKLVSEWAQIVLDVVAPGGEWIEPRPAGIICDHDAEGRATLQAEIGLPTIPAEKAVKSGIQALQRRLNDNRMKIHRDAVVAVDPLLREAGLPACTVEEIGGYVWDARKEAPVKENDHGADAARYTISHRDLRPRVGIRWLGRG